MIYHKTWYRATPLRTTTYQFDGWFLLGFIPLYVTRKRI